MTRNEIIEKAEEAEICLQDMRYHYDKLDDNFIDKLNVFAELVSMKVYLEGVEAGKRMVAVMSRKE